MMVRATTTACCLVKAQEHFNPTTDKQIIFVACSDVK